MIFFREEGGSFELIRFNKGERETPLEIVETEHQMAQFLKKGVNMITREGRLMLAMVMAMVIAIEMAMAIMPCYMDVAP